MLVVFSLAKLKVETTKSKVTTTVFNNKGDKYERGYTGDQYILTICKYVYYPIY